MVCHKCERWLEKGEIVYVLCEYMVVDCEGSTALESFQPDDSGLYCKECLVALCRKLDSTKNK